MDFSNTKKAGLYACLFLLVPFTAAATQPWAFDENTRKAYDLVLNLQIEEALQLIPQPKTAQEHYICGMAEAIELLITEDREKFSEYEDRFQKRMHEKIKGAPQDYQFLHAELNLQWAFVYLKFGQEFDAGSRLREAYHIAETCRRQAPD